MMGKREGGRRRRRRREEESEGVGMRGNKSGEEEGRGGRLRQEGKGREGKGEGSDHLFSSLIRMLDWDSRQKLVQTKRR